MFYITFILLRGYNVQMPQLQHFKGYCNSFLQTQS